MSDGHPFAPGERNAMHEAPLPTGREATAQQLSLAGAYDHLYESDEPEVAEEQAAEKPKRKPRVAKHEKADEKTDDAAADDAGDESDDE